MHLPVLWNQDDFVRDVNSVSSFAISYQVLQNSSTSSDMFSFHLFRKEFLPTLIFQISPVPIPKGVSKWYCPVSSMDEQAKKLILFECISCIAIIRWSCILSATVTL